jgi:quinol monooxygenase YgiN
MEDTAMTRESCRRWVLFSTVFLCLIACIAPGYAQDARYSVSYIEVASPKRTTAIHLLRALRDAARREAGNSGFEILQRIGRPWHFAILESWNDTQAQASHAAMPDTKLFSDNIKALLTAPIDERPLLGFAAGPAKTPGARAIYVVTHVDLIGPKKDEGLAALRQLSADSTKDAGRLRFDVLQQTNRLNHLTLVEVWRDQAALQAHEAADHTRKFRETLLPASGSPYDQRLYKIVR